MIAIDRVAKEGIRDAAGPELASRCVKRRYSLRICAALSVEVHTGQLGRHAMEEASAVNRELGVQCIRDLINLQDGSKVK